MARYAMAIDLDRCLACQACVIACKMENNVPDSTPESFKNRQMTFRTRVVPLSSNGKYPHPRVEIYPVLCNQCDNPPCVAACPTGATTRREDGIVLIDWAKCTGCRYCMAVCPYDQRVSVQTEEAKSFHNPDAIPPGNTTNRPPKGKVDKCTFCAHLVDKGQPPACVTACPASARVFGDLDEPNGSLNKVLSRRNSTVLRPDFGTNPHVFYLLKG
ncbi:MAG: molybdopterin oxidoreductase, iron-sulfur binding subunit [Dehalococcoidia bacterium]|nr:molybdopterin oxidoreductase, iron-sulfur binding subunit [Dehalococcoidia bacterium]